MKKAKPLRNNNELYFVVRVVMRNRLHLQRVATMKTFPNRRTIYLMLDDIPTTPSINALNSPDRT